MNPREILIKFRWSDGLKLRDLMICYIHRGAPGDLKWIGGGDIASLGRSFFDCGETKIPYHRIVEIRVEGKTIFVRRSSG